MTLSASQWARALLPLALLDCADQPIESRQADSAAALVLFVGNSLTYANDLPGVVRDLAVERGHDAGVRMVAHPNFSLEDHWSAGIGDSIRRIRPDFVIMQQGPSSLPESRADLIEWSDSLARVTRAAGGEPIVLMVWPPLERAFAWDDVRDSYLAAADAAGARVVPAGERIRALLAADPRAPLLAADGFHPAPAGTRVMAEAIVGVLFPGVRAP